MSSLTSGGRSQDPPSKPGERGESTQSHGKLQTPKGQAIQAISGNKKATKDYKQSADEDETSTPGDPCDEHMKITELQEMGIALCVAAKTISNPKRSRSAICWTEMPLVCSEVYRLNIMSFRFLVMQLHPSLTTLTR